MTLKNKTEEPKKEKTEPVAATNDDLVCNICNTYTNNYYYRRDYSSLFSFYSPKKTNAFRRSLTCSLTS